jgi:hypothetical protein
MSQREKNLLWLKDMLDHLRGCQRELQLAEDPETIQLLTETMLRELECCRRVCETLRRQASFQLA